MAHGSGTGSTVLARGTAYRCSVAMPQTKSQIEMESGSVFVAVAAPASISLAPLGALTSITVYHRGSQPSGGGATETELLVIEDQAKIEQVKGSLEGVVEDPMKYIPTHRVQIEGDVETVTHYDDKGNVKRATGGHTNSSPEICIRPAASATASRMPPPQNRCSP